MLEIKYEIRLDENGDPYTHLSSEYEEIPEDKFMVLDLASRVVSGAVNDPNIQTTLSPAEFDAFKVCNVILHSIKRDAGRQLKKRMIEKGVETLNQGKDYDVEVPTIAIRNSLNYNGIIYENKIFKRAIGLRVLVLETMEIFQLVDGIDNIHWNKIK